MSARQHEPDPKTGVKHRYICACGREGVWTHDYRAAQGGLREHWHQEDCEKPGEIETAWPTLIVGDSAVASVTKRFDV